MKRRSFIKGTGAAMAGGIIMPWDALSTPPRISANDKITFGVIGCNGMGWSNTNSLLKQTDVDLVAICDVDNNVIQRRLAD
jgi:hypothetical protein